MVVTRSATRNEEDELQRAIAASLRDVPQSKRTPGKRKQKEPGKPKQKESIKQKQQGADSKKPKANLRRTAGVKKETEATVEAVAIIREKKKKLLLKLSVNYHRIPYKAIRSFRLIPEKQPKDYWPWPRYPRLKLGHNPWKYFNWQNPTEDQVRQVHAALTNHHAKFEFEQYVDMPVYATNAACTVDVIIQTMFAQSTDNAIAIDVHSRLCNAFPYVVNGQKYVGKIPNWHEVRHLPAEELETALQSGGMKELRAKRILKFLNAVYNANLQRKQQDLQALQYDGNAPGASDFVPGMLSLDYMFHNADDNSDEALIRSLTDIDGVGLKSAMCILAFALKRSLFVVDTHVLRITKLLG